MNSSVIKALAAVAIVAVVGTSQAFAGGLQDCWKVDFSFTSGSGWNTKNYTGQLFYTDDCTKSYKSCDYKLDFSKFCDIKIFDNKGKDCYVDKNDCKITFDKNCFKGLNCNFYSGRTKCNISYDWCKIDWNKCKVTYCTPCKPPKDDCNVVPTPAAASAGLAMLGLLGFRRRRAA